MPDSTRPTIAVLGANGRLGATLVAAWREVFTVIPLTRAQLDLTKPEQIARTWHDLAEQGTRAVVNASGVTSLEVAEAQPELAWQVNATAVGQMARLSAERGMRFLHFSTDYVFDGTSERPYCEEDTPCPLSVYGRSKLAGEEATLSVEAPHAVFRVAWVFGPGRPAFPDMILRRALAGEEVTAIADKWSCPTSAEVVARLLQPHVVSSETVVGLFHLCQSGVCTWWDYARETLAIARRLCWLQEEILPRPITLAEMTTFTARRPRYTPLDTSRLVQATGQAPGPWPEALADYLQKYFVP